jgi:aldehyde:ferredoxin oxidoreductase
MNCERDDTVGEFHFGVPETAVPPWEKPQPIPPVANKEKFEAMREEFYSLRGWDPLTGVPAHSKPGKLGLDDVAQGLARAVT